MLIYKLMSGLSDSIPFASSSLSESPPSVDPALVCATLVDTFYS